MEESLKFLKSRLEYEKCLSKERLLYFYLMKKKMPSSVEEHLASCGKCRRRHLLFSLEDQEIKKEFSVVEMPSDCTQKCWELLEVLP